MELHELPRKRRGRSSDMDRPLHGKLDEQRSGAHWQNRVIYEARGLRKSDVVVIRKYNWMIKSLSFDRVGYRILDDLRKLLPDGTLLPNPKKLFFFGGSYEYLPTFMNLGRLTSFDIKLDTLDEHSAAQVNSLPSTFSLSSTSDSRYFGIGFRSIDFRYPCVRTPLDRWYCLRELKLGYATPEAVFYASHLRIEKFSGYRPVDHDRLASNPLPFPELQHFEIKDIALHFAHRLLPLPRYSALKGRVSRDASSRQYHRRSGRYHF
ncbi:hypothetical protein NP233_g2226 [Leucocoprinus birnbaumii]|uniref:Uncharacterized protein n=1 Tax=Leucocoprinus birnbaumii TaxID=56174 RepID=A0AAD5YU12_9AGAR|nr:hypothetical protein NP233_g2226 [Leucocoprinus birnbaumii]